MDRIQPFSAYRYTALAGAIENLVTQPYDKISPRMQERYLSLSSYNLVRVILGQRFPGDSEGNDVYTRARRHVDDWTSAGILARDPRPALYAYTQEFAPPDGGATIVRSGLIGLGPVVDYSQGIVHRHEQTLSGPKKDRLELLRHTRAHFGQIFMLYPDPELAVDGVLAAAATAEPIAVVTDEYETIQRVWQIDDTARVRQIQELMANKKLLIADGHHRYETALAFRDENPGAASVQYVMMTFVNMYSPGLKILATHRVLRNLEGFTTKGFLAKLEKPWTAVEYDSLSALKRMLANGDGGP